MRNNSKIIETVIDNAVKKSNELGMSKLSHGLNISQMQLLAYAIYATQQNSSSTFTKRDIEEKFNRERYQTPTIHTDIDRLSKIQIIIKGFNDDADSKAIFNVFSSIAYSDGEFDFEWNNRMIPHILDLKERYIVTDLVIAGRFESSHSWILYEYLKSHYGYWSKTVEKEELLSILGLQDVKSYKQAGSLKKHILNLAIEEINKYTELQVRYEDIKEGRSIVGFKFSWSVGTSESMITLAQQKYLEEMISDAMSDTLKFLDMKDKVKMTQVRDLSQELKELSHLIRTDAIREITSEKAKQLINEASEKIQLIEILYKSDLEDQRNPIQPTKKVTFYNWLEERECRSCGNIMKADEKGSSCKVCSEYYRQKSEERERHIKEEGQQ